MQKKWSDEAWLAARPVYDRILQLPFIHALRDGTLSPERFRFYLTQDSLYLRRYTRVLAHLASRLDDCGDMCDMLEFARNGVAVEQSMHAGFIGDGIAPDTVMSPACALYTSTLEAASLRDTAVHAAAILPCFWVYRRVGLEISRGEAPGNPWHRWIETYADPAFEDSTLRAIAICDRLAAKASEDVRREMTEIFVRCTRLEWMFWQSAWDMEQWPV